MKKVVFRMSRVFLVLALALSAYAWLPVNVEAAEDNVIPISDEADLELLRQNPSGHFQLVDDIALNDEFVPIEEFYGTLDGNGHKIVGLSIKASEDHPKAAFIVINYGVIEHIGFEDVNIRGLSTNSTYRAGGMVESNRGIIRESYVTGSITGGYRSAGIAVTNYGQIENVYANVEVRAKWESGGLVAVMETGSVLENSYAVCEVHSEQNNTGGIAAYAYTGAILRNNAVLAGTIDNEGGGNIARIVGRLNGSPTLVNNIASEQVLVQGGTVMDGTANDRQGLSVSDDDLAKQATYELMLGWDFSITWEMSARLGRPILRQVEEAADIPIATAADLELIRANPHEDYRLIADIELREPFEPIPYFDGTLDGNGHAISGLTIVAQSSPADVAFILENHGVIEFLGLIDVAVAGVSDSTEDWSGGMTAANYGTIQISYVTGMITGGYRSGGIAVHNYGHVHDVYVDGVVNARAESAMVVAVSETGSVLENTLAVPDVHSELNNTGGITAYAYTGAIIRNNALLAGKIDNDGGSNIARIVGRIKGSPTLANNIASASVLVQGSPVTGGSLNDRQGLTVDDETLSSSDIYQQDLGWNFERVWEFSTDSLHPELLAFSDTPDFVKPRDTMIYRVYRDVSRTIVTGVVHRQMDMIDANGYIQKVNVIDVDLNLPQLSIIVGTKNNQIPPTDEDGNYIRVEDEEGHDVIKANVAVQAATTQIPGKRVVAGVNGEFYTEQGPEGHMIKDGHFIKGVRASGTDGKRYPFHGFFGITYDGEPVIGSYEEDWNQWKDNLYQASGGQFRVVQDGTVQDFHGLVISDPNDPNYDYETYYRYKDRHPRTAAGIRNDGTVFFVVVDGRKANGSTGFYIEELGLFMKDLGAYQALNMDGGGSSTAVTLNEDQTAYEIVNTPINKVNGVNTPGVPRDVFSSLLVLTEEP